MPVLRYTATYTKNGTGKALPAQLYTRSIQQTPLAIAWGKQVGLRPTSACSSSEKGTDCMVPRSNALHGVSYFRPEYCETWFLLYKKLGATGSRNSRTIKCSSCPVFTAFHISRYTLL